MHRITREWLRHCERGAFTRAQLKLLGVWPPKAGWRQRLEAEGREITDEQRAAIEAARDVMLPRSIRQKQQRESAAADRIADGLLY